MSVKGASMFVGPFRVPTEIFTDEFHPSLFEKPHFQPL